MNGSQSRKRRRRLKFNVRRFLLIVFLISISLAWLAHKRRAAERQHRNVKAIVAAGGLVWYDFQVDKMKQPYRGQTEPQFRRWLRRMLGQDFFQKVDDVDFNNPDNEMVRHIVSLTSLKRLWLMGDRVTDETVSQLRGLRNLESLTLDGTRISDDGLRHLNDLSQLRILSLNQTQVTDDGLKHIKELTDLTGLYLRDTQVTTEGFQSIRRALPSCQIVGP